MKKLLNSEFPKLFNDFSVFLLAYFVRVQYNTSVENKGKEGIKWKIDHKKKMTEK